MNQSLLILGRQPALGLAELESLYSAEHLSSPAAQIAVLDMPTDQIDFKRLGGSTRLARLLSEVPSNKWKDVEKQLVQHAVEIASTMPAEGKLKLGISTFGIPITPQKVMATGLTVKKVVRAKSGRSTRLVPNQELELNTAQVVHNHLTGDVGLELLVVATTKGTTLLAATVAVQDIDGYTLRDRERPNRDARVGMLPPKLAQILVNLAAGTTTPSNELTVLDPFCGTGVVLQEALLMGYSAYGTDLEPRMIDYSNANLAWLNERWQIAGVSTVEQGDATAHQWGSPISLVATETYLGRPFTDTPQPGVLQTTIGDCNIIITKFLRNIWEYIPYGTRLCVAVPAWQTTPNKFRHLPLVDDIENLGYNRVSFEHSRDEQLLYYREDQIVARELLVITRK